MYNIDTICKVGTLRYPPLDMAQAMLGEIWTCMGCMLKQVKSSYKNHLDGLACNFHVNYQRFSIKSLSGRWYQIVDTISNGKSRLHQR